MGGFFGARPCSLWDPYLRRQAPMLLESSARGSGILPFKVIENEGLILLDWRPAIAGILERRTRQSASSLAAAFHGGLAIALADAAELASGKTGTRRVVLSGGVWQNRRLFSLVIAHLSAETWIPSFMPCYHRMTNVFQWDRPLWDRKDGGNS